MPQQPQPRLKQYWRARGSLPPPYFSPPILLTSFHSASVTGCTDRRPYLTKAMSLSFVSALIAASVTGFGNGLSATVVTATHGSFFSAVGSAKDSRITS